MSIHPDIRVHPWRHRHNLIAQRACIACSVGILEKEKTPTLRRNPIIFISVVLFARVLIRKKVVPAVRLRTVLALEWKEVDQVAGRRRASLPDVKHMFVVVVSFMPDGKSCAIFCHVVS